MQEGHHTPCCDVIRSHKPDDRPLPYLEWGLTGVRTNILSWAPDLVPALSAYTLLTASPHGIPSSIRYQIHRLIKYLQSWLPWSTMLCHSLVPKRKSPTLSPPLLRVLFVGRETPTPLRCVDQMVAPAHLAPPTELRQDNTRVRAMQARDRYVHCRTSTIVAVANPLSVTGLISPSRVLPNAS